MFSLKFLSKEKLEYLPVLLLHSFIFLKIISTHHSSNQTDSEFKYIIFVCV